MRASAPGPIWIMLRFTNLNAIANTTMNHDSTVSAFSTEEHVRQVAQRIAGLSEAIHHALRQLTQDLKHVDSSSGYALLTEEYALRARANILHVDAKRFARADFPATQQEVIAILHDVNTALKGACSAQQLTELIVGLVLFATSIACQNNATISLLLGDLKQQVATHVAS